MKPIRYEKMCSVILDIEDDVQFGVIELMFEEVQQTYCGAELDSWVWSIIVKNVELDERFEVADKLSAVYKKYTDTRGRDFEL